MAEPLLFERRSWGEYTVVHRYDDPKGFHALTKHLVIDAGRNISYQYHKERSEVWTIIAGKALFLQDGNLSELVPGDVVQIPPLSRHSVKAITELHIIEVQQGGLLSEDDIVRLGITWEEACAFLRSAESR